MNRYTVGTLAGLLVGGMVAGMAKAASVTYTFNTSTPSVDISALPSAPLQSIDAEFGGTVVQTSAFGLGVASGHLFPLVIDAAPALLNIDGAGIPEFLQFNFQPSVQVQSISFTAFQDNGTIGLTQFLGDNPVVSYSTDGTTFSPDFVTTISNGNTFTFSDIPAGTQIEALRIGTNSLADAGDSFGVGSLKVDYAIGGGSTPPAAAPLPASVYSGLGMLGVMAGVSVIRRRKMAMA
jgi:hypothetical protein